MTLAPGTRLGPYEILGPLGAGGMGEVFHARDTRLERDFAVKVIHQRLALDPDRLSRFEKEARAAARLDHPNILMVHDVDTHDGSPYLVTELLEGKSLRAKLDAPPASDMGSYVFRLFCRLSFAHSIVAPIPVITAKSAHERGHFNRRDGGRL